MDKMDKYEEALQRAKELHDAGNFLMKQKMEIVFPELAESEDERVIKALETFINQPEIADKITFEARIGWLAWLEKQKESLHIPESCKENADSFTSRDERMRKAALAGIEYLEREIGWDAIDDIDILDIKYYLEKHKDLDKMIVVSPEVWDNAIADAYEKGKKDGEKHKEQSLRDFIDDFPYSDEQKEQKLADSEEKFESIDNAFRRGREVGFHEGVESVKLAEWSEEDKEIIEKLHRLLVICRGEIKFIQEADYNKMDNFLKSLRPPKDCSSCAQHLEGYISGRSDAENKLLEQFGAVVTPEDELHIKPRWKPSEGQMQYLLAVINDPNNAGAESCHLTLESIYNDLKKLK